MGKPMMIQEADGRRERIQRWKRAAALVAATSREVNAEFQAHARLKRI